MRPIRPAATVALLLAATLAASCTRPDLATGPVGPTAAPARASLVGTLTRLSCHTDQVLSVSGPIGPAGGELRVGGFGVSFPAGAVKSTETFEVNVARGETLELEAHAVGKGSYAFAVPVTVTMNLAGCGTLPSGLRAYYTDSDTKALLEDMGGAVDLIGRRLVFKTPHFSGYTVVWGSQQFPDDTTSAPADSGSTGY